jgi:hypothetical protein
VLDSRQERDSFGNLMDSKTVLDLTEYYRKGYPIKAGEFLVEKWQVDWEIKRLEELCANSVR